MFKKNNRANIYILYRVFRNTYLYYRYCSYLTTGCFIITFYTQVLNKCYTGCFSKIFAALDGAVASKSCFLINYVCHGSEERNLPITILHSVRPLGMIMLIMLNFFRFQKVPTIKNFSSNVLLA